MTVYLTTILVVVEHATGVTLDSLHSTREPDNFSFIRYDIIWY